MESRHSWGDVNPSRGGALNWQPETGKLATETPKLAAGSSQLEAQNSTTTLDLPRKFSLLTLLTLQYLPV
jgi:hypothetical protein